ncbi:MAG: hypothetical protein L6Q38_17915, partial [Nitrospira sp.]|nr:hypothetical protein [Nitrospira sp.]
DAKRLTVVEPQSVAVAPHRNGGSASKERSKGQSKCTDRTVQPMMSSSSHRNEIPLEGGFREF